MPKDFYQIWSRSFLWEVGKQKYGSTSEGNTIVHVCLSDIALVFDIGWLAKIILSKVSPNLSDEFTPGCLVKAASTSGHVFKILLTDDQTKYVQITEDVVKAAAGNYFNSKEVMTQLLD